MNSMEFQKESINKFFVNSFRILYLDSMRIPNGILLGIQFGILFEFFYDTSYGVFRNSTWYSLLNSFWVYRLAHCV